MKDKLLQYFRVGVDVKKMIGIYVCLLISGSVLLILANMFPSNLIRQNITESVEMFSVQGNYPYMGVQETAYAMDNWTEAALVGFYYTSDSQHPIYSAFVATAYMPENSTGVDRLLGVVQDAQWSESDYLLIRSSYWLGYSIILRPLLCFFDYQSCRMLLNVISYAVLMLTVFLIGKRMDGYVAVGFGTIATIFHYYVLSLQYTLGIFCVFIAFAAILYILYANKPINYVHFMFVVGILTAYFEWLSIPLVTFGLPVLVALLKEGKTEKIMFSKLFNLVFQSGIGWCLGYGLMIISKTLVAMLVVGNDAWVYFIERFTADSAVVMNGDKFVRAVLNLFHCVFPFNLIDSHKYQLMVICCVAILCVISIWMDQKNRRMNLMIAVVGCVPIAWYIVFKGHVTHVGIEFRTLMITYLAVWLLLENLLLTLFGEAKNVIYKKR